MTKRNPGASVRARLLNKARADGVDFQLLLTRYGLERLLYRMSVSRERDNFLSSLEKRTPVRDIQAVGTAAGAIWNPIAAARRLSDAMLRWRCISS